MPMKNATLNQIMGAIRESRGRFFGLYTKQGESINARFINESPSYVSVYDRNNRSERRLAKSSVVGVRISERSVGSTF
jgi:hypothetical protein